MDSDSLCMQVQKKNYRSQKKQAAKELQSTLSDSSVVVLADWLKVRGTLKSWTKLWCVLKPGLLVLYKSEKQKVSTVPGHLSFGKTSISRQKNIMGVSNAIYRRGY